MTKQYIVLDCAAHQAHGPFNNKATAHWYSRIHHIGAYQVERVPQGMDLMAQAAEYVERGSFLLVPQNYR